MNRNRLLHSIFVLAVLYFLYDAQAWLVRIPAYRHLYRGHPFYLPEGIKTSLQILLCMAAVTLSLGKNFRKTFTELGLNRGFRKGLLCGFLSTSPFFLGLAITHHLGKIVWPNIFYLAFFAPFAEELVVRAYGFGQLYRRCRWRSSPLRFYLAGDMLSKEAIFVKPRPFSSYSRPAACSSPGFITAGIPSGFPGLSMR